MSMITMMMVVSVEPMVLSVEAMVVVVMIMILDKTMAMMAINDGGDGNVVHDGGNDDDVNNDEDLYQSHPSDSDV